jgi:hypothetical protein
MDLNYLAEISKTIPELNALLNSNKPEDINALLQMQMMAKNMDYASAFFGGSPSSPSATATGSSSSPNANSSNNNNNNSSNNSKSSNMSSSKAMQDFAAAANSSMLSQYMTNSNLFNPSMYGSMSGGTLTSLEKSAKELSSGSGGGSGSRKRGNDNRSNSSAGSRSQANLNVAPNAADMLNSLFASAAKGSASQANLIPPDLSSYFSAAAAGNQPQSSRSSSKASASSSGNNNSGGGIIHGGMDYSSLFSHMTPSKLQEMTSLFAQSSKYPGSGIPDPLAANTLAANNAYLSPSLMKLQQEALNTQLMKPPKSSSSSSSSKIETPPPVLHGIGSASSPALSDKRSTPTKSLRDSPAMSQSQQSMIPTATSSPMPKYNFSAADLAISSHVENSRTPPALDLAAKDRSVPPKKRMEFSSIAELVAPPKKSKYSDEMDDDDDQNDDGGVLNLSKN